MQKNIKVHEYIRLLLDINIHWSQIWITIGGAPIPIGRSIGYRSVNLSITGSTLKQIIGGGVLVPTL